MSDRTPQEAAVELLRKLLKATDLYDSASDQDEAVSIYMCEKDRARAWLAKLDDGDEDDEVSGYSRSDLLFGGNW